MAWSIDRLGRSLIDLLGTIQHLEAVGGDLYLDQQAIDTTTPAGKLLFQLTGAFAEFERSMIRQRVRAGLNLIKQKLARDGKFVSKAGKVRKRLGRPGAEAHKLELARQELSRGTGIAKTARLYGLGTGTVHKLKRACWPPEPQRCRVGRVSCHWLRRSMRLRSASVLALNCL